MSINDEEDAAEPSDELFLARELERELNLDEFLEQTGDWKRATESALEQIAAMPVSELSDPLSDSRAAMVEKLRALTKAVDELHQHAREKFEVASSFMRDAVDVLDGRIALTTRTLNERHDEHTVSFTQLSSDVASLHDHLQLMQSALEGLRSLQADGPHDASFGTELTGKIEELGQQVLATLDASAVGMTRRQQDVENRLARLEATLSRQQRRARSVSEQPFFSIIMFLFFVNAFMIVWLRFWQ